VPYPANYGGVIDVFYKIKALHNGGVKIILHCFEYGREHASELEKYCEVIFYYKRQMSFLNLFKRNPFIINTRCSKELISNLLQNDDPILFEGLHSCFYLKDERLKNRKKIVRTHNIEHDYYANLSKVEKGFFQKIYFALEARKLKRFESVLQYASCIAAISKNDDLHFKSRNKNTVIVSAFHQNETININVELGNFVLYHGNLGVSENYNAAIYLCEHIFANTEIIFVIAGNNAPTLLKDVVKKYPNISLQENLSTESIITLINKAQINLLITQQATGIKLKLLAALYNGKHCIVNNEMIVNTGLEEFCIIGNTDDELIEQITILISKPFTNKDIEKRKRLENSMFSNLNNVKKLIDLL
jgi:hypothetical protein